MYYSPNGARAFVYVGGGDCINWELVRSVVVNPIIPSTLRLPNRNALTQLLLLKRNNLRFVNQSTHQHKYEILAFFRESLQNPSFVLCLHVSSHQLFWSHEKLKE